MFFCVMRPDTRQVLCPSTIRRPCHPRVITAVDTLDDVNEPLPCLHNTSSPSTPSRLRRDFAQGIIVRLPLPPRARALPGTKQNSPAIGESFGLTPRRIVEISLV